MIPGMKQLSQVRSLKGRGMQDIMGGLNPAALGRKGGLPGFPGGGLPGMPSGMPGLPGLGGGGGGGGGGGLGPSPGGDLPEGMTPEQMQQYAAAMQAQRGLVPGVRLANPKQKQKSKDKRKAERKARKKSRR
jgi:hypothetical protein